MFRNYYTSKDVAEKIGVTPATITNWLKRGYLKGFKVGYRWRISPEDFDTFVKECESGKTVESLNPLVEMLYKAAVAASRRAYSDTDKESYRY